MKEFGAVVIDADAIVHQLYEPGAEGFRQVVSLFGSNALSETGQIDRKKLARIVFYNPEAMHKLNASIHPLAARQANVLLAEQRRRRARVVALEAPLLIEAGWADMVNEIWVTTAPREVIFRRLNRKYGMSCDEVLARIRKQLPVSKQLEHATRVINTDTSLEHLKAKIKRLWEETNSG